MHYRLTGDDRIAKDHPGVIAIKDRIDDQYASGRVTQVSDQEMQKLVAEFVDMGEE